MWPLFVVLRLPARDLPPCVEQVGEPTYPQALLAQSPVEALHMCVLRGLAWLDMHAARSSTPAPRPGSADCVSSGPLSQRIACGHAAPGDDLIQHPRHAPAGEARVHFQRQALPREGIHHAQHADVAPGSYHIVCEIQRPLLVGAGQRGPRRSACARSACASSASGTVPPRDKPATAAYGSLARPRVPPAPATSDSHSAASLWPAAPAALATTHPIAATDTDNSITAIPISPHTRRSLAPILLQQASCAPSSGLRAQAVFCDHRLQHLLVQTEIRHQPLQTRVLIFQRCAAAAPRSPPCRRYLAFQA